MIINLPDTNSNAVGKALVDLREKYGAIALGRVLTLIVVVDEEFAEAAIDDANHASHEHPCRVIAVVARDKRATSRLDAQIRVGGDAGASDVVVLHTQGELVNHPASVVMPLLLPDAPVVTWWPKTAPPVPADDPVGRISQRRITDTAAMQQPVAALDSCRLSYRPGDTDLAWSRITLWRAILASALDQERDQRVRSASVLGNPESPSADLLAAWLAQMLRCPVERLHRDVEGLVSAQLDLRHGTILLDRAPDEEIAMLSTPGRPERIVALPRRLDRECLAEELRRLDPDDVYGEVLTKGMVRLELQAKIKKAKKKIKASKAGRAAGPTSRGTGKSRQREAAKATRQ